MGCQGRSQGKGRDQAPAAGPGCLRENCGCALTRWEPCRGFWAWPDLGLTGALWWLSGERLGPRSGAPRAAGRRLLCGPRPVMGGPPPGWAGREGGVGGLWPCLRNVGLIASGVYLAVNRDRWSAWRMMWRELLPRVLSFPRTCCRSRAGRTLSPRTLDLPQTLPETLTPSRFMQRSEVNPKHRWRPQPQHRQPLGLSCQSFVLYIYSSGRQNGLLTAHTQRV